MAGGNIMYRYILNKRFLILFSISLITLATTVSDAWSGGLNTFITSPLTITDTANQNAECIVANVGSTDIRVNVTLISPGSTPLTANNVIVSPNNTFSIDSALTLPAEFFCKFNYFGNAPMIRGAARVLDFSGGDLSIPQRAEAR